MVADEITKEQAAKFIKQLEQKDGNGAERVMMANVVQTLFDSFEDAELSEVNLEEGEANQILTDSFEYEDM